MFLLPAIIVFKPFARLALDESGYALFAERCAIIARRSRGRLPPRAVAVPFATFSINVNNPTTDDDDIVTNT